MISYNKKLVEWIKEEHPRVEDDMIERVRFTIDDVNRFANWLKKGKPKLYDSRPWQKKYVFSYEDIVGWYDRCNAIIDDKEMRRFFESEAKERAEL